jgi:predicted dehydrogenase
MTGTIRVGIIGYGYWGPNLARNFSEVPGFRLNIVADKEPGRLHQAQIRLPRIRTTEDAAELISAEDVELVAIATPVATHFDLAMSAIEAGKHVLIEKPMAATSEQCQLLVEAARDRHLTLMVDHTFVYTGAVRKIVELVRSGELGELYYYDSVRINLGLFQSDVNVVWDLAVHDLSIMDVVMPEQPEQVSAVGVSHVPGQPENIAYITLLYPHRRIAHLHVNWLAPVKVRRTLIGCRDRMLVYDDVEPSEKIKIYDKGARIEEDPETVHRLLVSYRYGDMWAPRLDTTEAMASELIHLRESIHSSARPLTDGHAGVRIVTILEAAAESMQRKGELVPLDLAKVP